jgi:DNA-binding GntR family transcriptional regulator
LATPDRIGIIPAVSFMPSLEKQAYRHLRGKLLRGELAPGEALSDLAVAQQIGMSRTPVRHAIRMLESEGLVSTGRRGGSTVRKLTAREMVMSHDTRALLEGYAAAHAARRITDAQLAELARLQTRVRAIGLAIREAGAKTYDDHLALDLARTDIAFHRAILRAASCRSLARAIDPIQLLAMLGQRRLAEPPLRHVARVLLGHGRILRALEARDPGAARRAMRAHIAAGKRAQLASDRSVRRRGAEPNWPPGPTRAYLDGVARGGDRQAPQAAE